MAVVAGAWSLVVLLVIGMCRAAARGDAELLWAASRERRRMSAAGQRSTQAHAPRQARAR